MIFIAGYDIILCGETANDNRKINCAARKGEQMLRRIAKALEICAKISLAR